MTEIFMDSGATTQAQVMEAMLLAFKHSPMQALVTAGVLKLELEANWKTVSPRPGTLSLKGVLGVLKNQKGFDFDRMLPALCRIKTWEPYLKMEVEVPTEFVLKRIVDFPQRASACRVPDVELAKVLPSAAVALAVFSGGRLKPIASKPPEPEPKKSMMPALIGLGVAVVLLAAGGGAGFWWWSTQRVTPVDVAAVSDDIALSTAQRQGNTVTATLKDRNWLVFTKGERSVHVMRSLERLKQVPGVTDVCFQDPEGKPLACAHGGKQVAPTVEMFE